MVIPGNARRADTGDQTLTIFVNDAGSTVEFWVDWGLYAVVLEII